MEKFLDSVEKHAVVIGATLLVIMVIILSTIINLKALRMNQISSRVPMQNFGERMPPMTMRKRMPEQQFFCPGQQMPRKHHHRPHKHR